MTTFCKTNYGAFVCDFAIDLADPTLTDLPFVLPEFVAERIAEFVPSALPNRTYDQRALLGEIQGGDSPAEIRQTLLAVCSLPHSPIVLAPGSKPGRERYQLRPSLVVGHSSDICF